MSVETATIETAIPGRLDRLPWSRFHWLVVGGLGTVWILDGLEVTIVGSIAARLTEKGSGISLGVGSIGTAAAIYVAGACVGALFFGQLTDRFGRKRLFLITLGVYGHSGDGVCLGAWYFFLCRFFTGAGIGGEYAEINSAIDELIPARVRGRIDLMINGSYWVGAAAGAGAALFFLSSVFPTDVGWRITFALGAVLVLSIMFVRRNVPESPRWLFIHGREEEAERIGRTIEEHREGDRRGARRGRRHDQGAAARVDPAPHDRQDRFPALSEARCSRSRAVCRAGVHPQRRHLQPGNALHGLLRCPSSFVPVFIVVFAIGNFLGPLLLGRLFDPVGRIPMIAGSYLGSAAVAVALALLFAGHALSSAWAFEALVFGTFFLASAGAIAAYLTVSEVFPMETRALAIAFFYAVGTGLGGIIGSLLFGHLIATHDRRMVMLAFLIGAGVTAVGGIAEIFLGVRAANEQLEDVAKPLTAEDAEDGETDGGQADEHDDRQPDSDRQNESIRRAQERADRRARRERACLRRLRPGPASGEGFYSPGMLGTAIRSRQESPSLIDREIDAIGLRARRGRPPSPRGARSPRRCAPLGPGSLRARSCRGTVCGPRAPTFAGQLRACFVVGLRRAGAADGLARRKGEVMRTDTKREVVVVTGASGGVGRAIAHAFAKRGAQVGLLARGEAGLKGARREVESFGGQALVVPTDVADYEQVEAAAQAVEREYSPIDVWVNDAMATIFARFLDVRPEGFKRATEVSYLGAVYGTMVALQRMVPRDRGAVVQVGSALSHRAIPLQSAYCGAKFAMRLHRLGPHRADARPLECLDHDGAAAGSEHAPVQLVPDAAAPHHRHRELDVGGSAVKAIFGNRISPRFADWYLASTGFKSQQIQGMPVHDRPDNLFEPVPQEAATHGMFDSQARDHSYQLWADTHRPLVAGALAAAGAGLARLGR